MILDEAYVEFQTDDDPDATARPARRLPQPGRPAHLQQVLRPGRAAGRLRDRLGRASAPRSTPCASRSASTPSPRRPGRRRSCTRTTSCAGSRRTIAERLRVEEALRELGLATAETQANFSWIDLGDAEEARGRRRPRRAPDRGAPRHAARRPRPHPRQLRHAGRERPLPRRPGGTARLIARARATKFRKVTSTATSANGPSAPGAAVAAGRFFYLLAI